MSTTNYTDMFYEVLPYAQNCPEPVALNALRNAAIDFFKKSLAWQYDLDPFAAIAGQPDYELDIPTNTALVKVTELYYLNRVVVPRSFPELDKMYTTNWRILQGTPKAYVMSDPVTVTVALMPAETVPAAFTGRVAITPTILSTGIDSLMANKYIEGIAAGALYRLYSTPNQAYTDTNMAALKFKQFESAKGKALADIMAGQTGAPMRVRFNRIQ